MSGILWNEISAKASGGTELLARRLEKDLDPTLLEQVQIVPSRLYTELDESKIRILWLHDLPHDPESKKILENGGWRRFHLLVFVSNFQMQAYIGTYQIPWSKCVVIPNSIVPIERDLDADREDDVVRFIYHTTPHRGLDVLYRAFDQLSKKHSNVHLDVYSSFEIYGWEDRNQQFQELFDLIKSHDKMTYHGTVSNDEVRAALVKADVFAYPSTWIETSCLSLIEAMSAGLTCIHSNLGALYETASHWTQMYQFREVPEEHAEFLFRLLDANVIRGQNKTQIKSAKLYTDTFHNWNVRKTHWISMIEAMQDVPRKFETPKFSYRIPG